MRAKIEIYPRTLPPTAIYPPDGAHDIPAPAITLEWTAGIDAFRNNASWPWSTGPNEKFRFQ